MKMDGPWWAGLPGTAWNDELPDDAFAGAIVAAACAEHLFGAPPGRGEWMPGDVDKLTGQLIGFLAAATSPQDAYARRVLVCIVCTGNIKPADIPRALKTRYDFWQALRRRLPAAYEGQ